MPKKTLLKEATDAVKSVAGAALGAAAVAATGVVVTSVAGAMRKRGTELEDAAPKLQRLAGETVTRPVMPKPQKRAAATRKAKTVKKKVVAKKASKARRRAKR
jgi:hypothetical protein